MSTEQKQNTRKERRQQTMSTMLFNKVPPAAKELEEAVLGAIMLERGAFDLASEILRPECFYQPNHQKIFKAMQSLVQVGSPLDLLTMQEKLQSSGELESIGGAYYLTMLTNAVVSGANVEAHARILLQKHIQREIIRMGGQMVLDGYAEGTDVFELLNRIETDMYSITSANLKKDFMPADAVMVETIQRIEQLRHSKDDFTGVPTGFTPLDRITCGWQNTDLIILAARPAIGKTAFALNLARNACLHPTKPTPVAFFSLEMGRGQLMQRMLSAESEIPLEMITRGRLDDDQMQVLFQRGIRKIGQAPLFIDDTAGLNMFELRAKSRRLKMKHRVGLIIIDYLQLMSGDTNKSDNREREISKISRELKKLAKDLEVPIIALSQLSREVEKRGKGQKVPVLADLRESGAIEQDADLVMFLYRPPDEEVNEDASLAGKGAVKIAKHRNGRLDDIVLKFQGEIQKWMTIDDAGRYERRSSGALIPMSKALRPEPVNDQEEDLPF